MRFISLLLLGALAPRAAEAACDPNAGRLDLIACRAEQAWAGLDRRVASLYAAVEAVQADVVSLYDELFALSDRVAAVEATTAGLRLAAVRCRWNGTTYEACEAPPGVGFDPTRRPIVSPRYLGAIGWTITDADPSLTPYCVMQSTFETAPGAYHVRPDAEPGGLRWSCVDAAGLAAPADACLGWQTWQCYYQPAPR
ncbi:MAG TPA: hypothetical protein PKA64_21625 [Myxococcota bacterium]|nr:hypothetical protein [Myxococcota bacterium]